MDHITYANETAEYVSVTVPRVVAEFIGPEWTVHYPTDAGESLGSVAYWLSQRGWLYGDADDPQSAVYAAKHLISLRRWFAGEYAPLGGVRR
jgi:hypothetical protein